LLKVFILVSFFRITTDIIQILHSDIPSMAQPVTLYRS